jgi:DNA-binding LacI/PurR family transcriptional regulator
LSTIFDIAREAGVSITTVSRALNGYSDVSETTRRRVVEIAQSHNYYPSAAARNLQGGRTDTVAFAPLLREHMESEQFFKEFLGLLTLSAFRHNLSLLATIADTPSHTHRIYRELAGSGRVDGVILADIKPQDERIALLGSLNLPFIAFGRTADFADLNYPLVDVDNAAGTRAVVDYLVSKGHRRLAYLSGPFNTSYSLHRYSGFCQSLEEHGLTVDSHFVIADLQEHGDTAQAVARLLSPNGGKNLRPTAIVAANDHLAWQVIQELQDRGISVGSDRTTDSIAVTGYDDLPFAGYVHPSLTTVRQPIAAISDILLDLLVTLIKNEVESKKKLSPEAKMTGHIRGRHTGLHKQDEASGGARSEQPTRWIGPMQALVAPELVVRASA